MKFKRAATALYLFSVLGALYSGACHAGRPLVTDDAGFVDKGGWELEGSLDRASEGASRTKGYSLGIAYGIGLNTQLGISLGGEKTDGVSAGGVGLSGKTGLWRNDSSEGLSLAYSLDWTKEPGARWVHSETGVGLIYSRPVISRVMLHTNLGHFRDEVAHVSGTRWGVALEHEGFGSVAPVAEVFGNDRSAPRWNVGLRWAVQPAKIFVHVSYGSQMVSGRPDFASVGFKVAF